MHMLLIPTSLCQLVLGYSKLHIPRSSRHTILHQHLSAAGRHSAERIDMAGSPSLKFTVRRQPAVLVPPAGPTPRELKPLSDIDDQDGLRFHIPFIYFFRRHDRRDDDPTPVLRDAIAAALVHYYPLAGRLRELEGRKLAVDCTGEGVLFVEADADVWLEHLDVAQGPPFPYLDELLFDVPGSSNILNAPVIHFQVTRLACGGFIMALKIQHTIVDGPGIVQFLAAVAELARGAAAPTVKPVWGRDLLMATSDALAPPKMFRHREYDHVPNSNTNNNTEVVTLDSSMTHRTFFFGRREVAAIRTHLPPALRRRATTFDVLTGCMWRCRTVALAPDADEETRLICIVGIRGEKQQSSDDDPFIPVGYYGNAFAFPAAVSTAGDLCANPVSYAVELVMKTKREVDVEYVRSVARLMVRRGRPNITMVHTYLMTDVSKAGFRNVNFGWGKPVYAGVAKGGIRDIPGPGVASSLISVKNANGEECLAAPVCLPPAAMAKFVEEMGKLMRPAVGDMVSMIKSAI